MPSDIESERVGRACVVQSGVGARGVEAASVEALEANEDALGGVLPVILGKHSQKLNVSSRDISPDRQSTMYIPP